LPGDGGDTTINAEAARRELSLRRQPLQRLRYLTGTIDRLKSPGFVERRGGGRDSRTRVLALTPKAKSVHE
jgi:DNA-binding MarR family transcriptional regulator